MLLKIFQFQLKTFTKHLKYHQILFLQLTSFENIGMLVKVADLVQQLLLLLRFQLKQSRNNFFVPKQWKTISFSVSLTVCLLSILFLLPYCCRGHAPLILSLGGWCLATYSLFVLPLLISANYRYPVRWLRQIASKLPGKCVTKCEYIKYKRK